VAKRKFSIGKKWKERIFYISTAARVILFAYLLRMASDVAMTFIEIISSGKAYDLPYESVSILAFCSFALILFKIIVDAAFAVLPKNESVMELLNKIKEELEG